MYSRSVVLWLGSRVGRRRWGIVVLLLGSGLLSWASAGVRLAEAGTAPWWPAAATAAVAVMVAQGWRTRLLVAVLVALVTGLANFAVGTAGGVAVGFGSLNGLAALLVAAVATRRTPSTTYGLADAVRLIAACAVGAVVAGVLTGAVVFVASGVGFVVTATGVAASHLSATLLLVPFALIPVQLFITHRRLELLAQLVLTTGILSMVFFPGQDLALTFAVFPSLIWLILRFPTGIVAGQVLLVAVVSLALTTSGAGPYSVEPLAMQFELIQVFSVSIAVTTLVSSGLINDQAVRVLRSRARDELLRSGIVNARAGFLMVERRESGRLAILEHNPTSARQLADSLEGGAVPGRVLHSTLLGDTIEDVLHTGANRQASFTDPDGRMVELRCKALRSGNANPLAIIETHDVTEQNESERAWQQTLQNEKASSYRLQELNRQKDVFLDAVGHELRTPTASILGYADLMADSARSDPMTGRSIEAITRNAERLTKLIDDIMVMSRTANAQPPADLHLFLLREVIDDVVRDHEHRASEKDIKVEIVFGEDTMLYSDREDVHRILGNLLENAIKFGRSGSTVVISGQTAEGQVRLDVTSTGYSPTRGDLEHAFERFYRAADVVCDAVPGTGIGLSIVKALTEQLGGTAALTAVGEKVSATVTLPVHASSRAQELSADPHHGRSANPPGAQEQA